MNSYRFTLKHDGGKVKVSTTASTLDSARKTVLKYEGAPVSAIIKQEWYFAGTWIPA